MVDKHSQSFFGQSTGLTLLSSSRNDPYLYFKCIKKKQNGSWEKPSAGEGKTIKCNLDEIIMILQVLKKNEKAWSSFHNFNDSKTQISFKWDEKNFPRGVDDIVPFITPFVDNAKNRQYLQRKNYKLQFSDYNWDVNSLQSVTK